MSEITEQKHILIILNEQNRFPIMWRFQVFSSIQDFVKTENTSGQIIANVADITPNSVLV